MDFYVVYIREAHATDGWQLDANRNDNVLIAEANTPEDRRQAAQSCAIGLNLTIPMLVDSIDDLAERTFGAWPERLYVISADGTVTYQGGKGPYGFKPEELEEFLASN
jgi:hypothetical protein